MSYHVYGYRFVPGQPAIGGELPPCPRGIWAAGTGGEERGRKYTAERALLEANANGGQAAVNGDAADGAASSASTPRRGAAGGRGSRATGATAGRGSRAARTEPPRAAQLPYLFVLTVTIGALAWIWQGGVQHAKEGTLALAGAMFIGALARLVLPKPRAGMLASRRRLVDVVCLAALAVGLLVAGLVLPIPS
jgi:Protein of unknown function (DUF3017)